MDNCYVYKESGTREIIGSITAPSLEDAAKAINDMVKDSKLPPKVYEVDRSEKPQSG